MRRKKDFLNHKRGKPRKNVRCRLCTDSRDDTGSDRQQRKREAFAADSPRVTNGQHFDFCPDCCGTGRCEHDDCELCPLCGGSGVTDYLQPQEA